MILHRNAVIDCQRRTTVRRRVYVRPILEAKYHERAKKSEKPYAMINSLVLS